MADREKVAIGVLLAAIIAFFMYRAHERETLQLFKPIERPIAAAVDGWELPLPEPSAAAVAPETAEAQQEAMGKLRSIVTACARLESQAGRKLQPGLLALTVSVVDGGRIDQGSFSGDVEHSAELDACVAEALSTLVVPEALAGIELTVEFNLK